MGKGFRKYKDEDVVGKTYGRLTVVEAEAYPKFKCLCICGTTKVWSIHSLVSGNTSSCGCLPADNLLKRNTTHGLSKHPAYNQWKGMKKRIHNDKEKRKWSYALKGISIHPDFENSFEKFLAEIGEKPNDGQRWSVGRIDNDGDYTYGNIRWETDEQQARNHSLQKNNTSGVCGIQLDYYKGEPYCWVACWTRPGENKRTKSFLIKRYGDAEAKQMAIDYRKEMLKKLEEDHGIVYAESHGSSVKVVNNE